MDVLDRVLAKGIVIGYDADVPGARLRVIEIDGHVTVQSLETRVQNVRPGDMRDETSEALIAAAEEYLRRVPYGDALAHCAG